MQNIQTYQVKGISLREGKFLNKDTGETFDYSYYLFHCLTNSENPHDVGMSCVQIKVKTKYITHDNITRAGIDELFDELADKNVIFYRSPVGKSSDVIGFSIA